MLKVVVIDHSAVGEGRRWEWCFSGLYYIHFMKEPQSVKLDTALTEIQRPEQAFLFRDLAVGVELSLRVSKFCAVGFAKSTRSYLILSPLQ
jgi:hypothetical protein